MGLPFCFEIESESAYVFVDQVPTNGFPETANSAEEAGIRSSLAGTRSFKPNFLG